MPKRVNSLFAVCYVVATMPSIAYTTININVVADAGGGGA